MLITTVFLGQEEMKIECFEKRDTLNYRSCNNYRLTFKINMPKIYCNNTATKFLINEMK